MLIANVVLLVGMLGVLSVLTGGLQTTALNNERVAATNLARELVEETRALDYDDIAGSLVQTRLQSVGLGAGTPWTIQRRGVTYTVTAAPCTYDDPTDGLASPAPQDVCTPQPGGSGGDSNGDDFRRTTFGVAWEDRGRSRAVTQTTLVANPSGGLGPRITGFIPVTQTITANVSSATVVWSTTAAQSLRWTVDDGAGSGSSSGSTSFTSTWSIGTSGSAGADEVLDGSYQIIAQPFDDRDIAGEVKRASIVLNRRAPYAPTGFAGGYDTRLATLVDLVLHTLHGGWVDLQWSPGRERDLLGYRVMWAGLDGVAGNGDDSQVCPLPVAGAMLPAAATSCAAPPPLLSLATKYYIVAIDRGADGQPRDGDRQTLTIAAAAARPAAPTGPLTVQTVNDQPKLGWSAPSSGSVSMYRVYRDGSAVDVEDRYDRTAGDVTTYVDESPGDVGHQYWVTAVDARFNESNPIGPVSWSP